MTIVRWDPFRDFGFAAPSTWMPPVDVFQTGSRRGLRRRRRRMAVDVRRDRAKQLHEQHQAEGGVHDVESHAVGAQRRVACRHAPSLNGALASFKRGSAKRSLSGGQLVRGRRHVGEHGAIAPE